jgi:hypothetical protein
MLRLIRSAPRTLGLTRVCGASARSAPPFPVPMFANSHRSEAMALPLRFPASLEAPYHTVDALHDALRATVARSDSLTLEWLRDDSSAQVEGVDDDGAPPLAVLRTQDTTRAADSAAPRRLRALSAASYPPYRGTKTS